MTQIYIQHALQQDCPSHRLFEDESHPDAKSRRGRLFFPKSGGGVGKMGPADWLNNKLSPALRIFHGSCYEGYKGRKYIRKSKSGSERQKWRQVIFMHRGRGGRGYSGREGADGVDKGNQSNVRIGHVNCLSVCGIGHVHCALGFGSDGLPCMRGNQTFVGIVYG